MNTLGVILFVIFCGTVEGRRDLEYFKAYLKRDGLIGHRTILKFDNVVANIGHGYNPHSGVFTAPVSGIYMLSVILGTGRSGAGDFAIKNQGTNEAYITIKSGHDIGPMTTLAHVKKGNHVYVMRTVGGSKFVRGWGMTQFSGFLIQAD